MNTRDRCTREDLRRRLRRGGSIIAVALACFGLPGQARAADGTAIPDGYQLVTTDLGEQVLAPIGPVADKASWLRAHPAYATVHGPSSLRLASARGSVSGRPGAISPMGSTVVGGGSISSAGSVQVLDSYIATSGSTSVSYFMLPFYGTVTFTNSNMTDTWYGLNPYNANSISPSMKWWLTGINVTLSVPAGASFSGSGGSAVVWAPGQSSNRWQVSGSYSQGIDISANYVWSANFQTAGDFDIGGHWYHVYGN